MKDERMKLNEVVMIGERVLFEMKKTSEYVRSINSRWLFEIFSNNKNNHTENIKQYLGMTKREMKELQAKVEELSLSKEMSEYVGRVMNYFEFFFDDVINDYIADYNAKATAEKIEQAGIRLESMLIELNTLDVEKAS